MEAESSIAKKIRIFYQENHTGKSFEDIQRIMLRYYAAISKKASSLGRRFEEIYGDARDVISDYRELLNLSTAFLSEEDAEMHRNKIRKLELFFEIPTT